MRSGYNILLLGLGGREHTLAWKLRQSPECRQLWIAPGNGGTATEGTNVALDPMDFNSVGEFCLANAVDMLVVGPEAPLVGGIADYFSQTPELNHLLCIGPSGKGAMLEGSKAFAKEFMQRHGIPTAACRTFTKDQGAEGCDYLREHGLPVVLKADGLAAGKGVLICTDRDDALHEFEAMLAGKFGTASATVVIEEFLSGIEFSVFVLTDGKDYVLLPEAKDYKRIGEGDTGLNTGGMGSVSPVPFVGQALWNQVRVRIIEPTIAGLHAEKIAYRGFLFFGLINVKGDPFVIEYNCRMGDPETQVVIPRLQSDLVTLLAAAGNGTLHMSSVEVDSCYAVTTVCASEGYPGSYATGAAIHLPELSEDTKIFHAGTTRNGDDLLVSGGRVLAVTAMADSLEAAMTGSRSVADKVRFEGKYYRRDIGADLLKYRI